MAIEKKIELQATSFAFLGERTLKMNWATDPLVPLSFPSITDDHRFAQEETQARTLVLRQLGQIAATAEALAPRFEQDNDCGCLVRRNGYKHGVLASSGGL